MQQKNAFSLNNFIFNIQKKENEFAMSRDKNDVNVQLQSRRSNFKVKIFGYDFKYI